MSPTDHPLDPDHSYLPAGHALTFAVMRAMADLDAYRMNREIAAVERPTLEWAYLFMAQSYFAAVSSSCGEDQQLTQSRILEFVHGCETVQALKDVIDNLDVAPTPPTTARRDEQP